MQGNGNSLLILNGQQQPYVCHTTQQRKLNADNNHQMIQYAQNMVAKRENDGANVNCADGLLTLPSTLTSNKQELKSELIETSSNYMLGQESSNKSENDLREIESSKFLSIFLSIIYYCF